MFVAQATGNVKLGQNYPNPAKEKTYIPVEFSSSSASLTIVDLLGKKVEEKVLNNSGTFEINVSEYPEGIYLYTLDADGMTLTKRMTVVNR